MNRIKRTYLLGLNFALLVLLCGGEVFSADINNPPAEIELACWQKLDCFSDQIGLNSTNTITDQGEKLQQLETTDYIIQTQRNFLGLFESIDIIDKMTMQLVQRDWLFPHRVTQHFSDSYKQGKPELVRQREIHRLSENKQSYRILTTDFSDGKPVRQSSWIINGNSRLLQYSRCLSGVTPVSLSIAEISRSVRSVFKSEETSTDRLRLINDSCPASYEREVAQAMTQGMRCMLDSRRGGGGRSQRDVGLLIAMMTNPNQRYTVKCFQGSSGIPGHGHVYGAASMCGDSSNHGKAPYPGINIDVDAINAVPSDRRSARLRSTIYHEMLHTLGYPHGHAPDVSYLCEFCCFGSSDSSRSQKELACNLCRNGDSPDAEYIAKLFTYTQASNDTQSDQYGFDFAYLSMLNYARNSFHLQGNKNINAQIALEVIQECPGQQASSCSYEMARAVLVLLRSQQLLSSASTEGVRSLTSEELTIITQLEASLGSSEENQAAILAGGLLAGHVRGGSLDYARRFSRTQQASFCQSIPTSERPYISSIMPPIFEIEYSIDSDSIWQTACGN